MSISVRLDVTEALDFTSIAAVDRIVEADIEEILSDAGEWSLTVAPNAACRDLLTVGRCVTFSVGDDILAAGLIRKTTDHRITREGQETFTVSGPTWFSITDRAACRPTRGFGGMPFGPTRSFGFWSIEYDETALFTDFAVEITPTLDAGAFDVYSYWISLPSGLPAFVGYQAKWIGPVDDDTQASQGPWYVLVDITFDDPFFLRAFLAGDNSVLNFAAGFNIPTSTNLDNTTQAFTTAADYFLRGDAGTIRFAMKVVNADPTTGLDPGFGEGSSDVGNPTGLIGVWFHTTPAGELLEKAFQTTDGWKMLAYPDVPPGMTHGQVARIILGENQDDGILTGLALDCTDLLDANGNPMDILEVIDVQVGDSLAKSLKEWSQTGCDSRIDYATGKVQLFRLGEAGGESGVTWTVNSNPRLNGVKDLVIDIESTDTDCLMVHWEGPPIRVPASGGTSMRSLNTSAKTPSQAADLGEKVLAYHDLPEEVNADINPTSTTIPGRDALLGDIVHLADGLGGVLDERLMGWGVKLEGDKPTWSVRVKSRNLKGYEALDRLIQQQQNGTLGGRASSQPTPPPVRFAPQATTFDDTIQFDQDAMPGTSEQTDVPISTNLWAVSVRSTNPFLGDIEFTFDVEGVGDVLAGAGVLPAGEVFNIIPVAAVGLVTTVRLTGQSSKVSATVTSTPSVDGGSPGSGVVIKPLYVT